MHFSQLRIIAAAGVVALTATSAQAAPATATLSPSAASAARAFRAERAAAHLALAKLRRSSASLVAHWPAYLARPTMLRGISLALPGATNLARARALFDRYSALFVPSAQLSLADKRGDARRSVLRFRQTYRGLPVVGSSLTVSFDARGRVRAVHGSTARLTLASVRPGISAAAALAVVYRKIGAQVDARTRATIKPRLGVLAVRGGKLVYSVMPPIAVNPRGLVHTVDALSGAHLGAHTGILFHGARRRHAGVTR